MVRPLSIIVPHFQKQESLRQVFEELQLQLIPEDRILVVDDFSPNGVPDFDCSCTKVIHPPQKLTPHIYRLNTLRNVGLQHAPHDSCIILDPDCVPNPHFLDNARKMCDASVLFGGCIDRMQRDGSVKLDVRRKGDKSFWCDFKDGGGVYIYGGCMMFSKERTKLIGWFNEEYNGAWGAEEHDFASKCYHSGIRLRFSTELQVTHQWHPENRAGYERNKDILAKNQEIYKNHLNLITLYNPTIAVLIVSMSHPQHMDQVMRSIFRHPTPLKVLLINSGDQSEYQRRELAVWNKRWTVDYIDYKSQESLSKIREDAIRFYEEKGYKYLIVLNDDVTPIMDSLNTVISETGNHKPYYTTIKLNKAHKSNISDKKYDA
jgi:GT2 family glycosyltransferase